MVNRSTITNASRIGFTEALTAYRILAIDANLRVSRITRNARICDTGKVLRYGPMRKLVEPGEERSQDTSQVRSASTRRLSVTRKARAHRDSASGLSGS